MMVLRKEEYSHPRTIVLKNVRQESLQNILQNIKYGDIDSIQFIESDSTAKISFFNYLDLYLTVRDIESKYELEVESCPLQLNTKNAYHCGASRIVKINDCNNTKEHFEELVVKFGDTEFLNLTNNTMTVSFLSILSALKFAKYMQSNIQHKNKVFFEPDHCGSKKREQTDEFTPHFYSTNRTVYLGGIQENMTAEDIFNVIRGGYVFSLRILREKKCAFIVFMDSNAANAFLMYYEKNDFVIKNHKLKVSRGTETKILVQHILMCYSGASRSIIIDSHDVKFSREMLRKDFSRFGEIEQINVLTNKKLIFINFMSVQEAFNAYCNLRNKQEYKNVRMGFGKDRCYNETTEDMMNKVLKSGIVME